MSRFIELTTAEWHTLSLLPKELTDVEISAEHKLKLIQVGVAAEKGDRLVATFEGRLRLRQRAEI